MDHALILQKLVDLTHGYSHTYRTCFFAGANPTKENDLTDILCREPLMAHVGHVNIVATVLYPYLKTNLSLGHTLELLAVHDIGELHTGDVHILHKNMKNVEEERNSARILLDDVQFSWFEEFEKLETPESKFANSIDKISCDIVCLVVEPTIEKMRMKYYNSTTEAIFEKKIPYMKWDSFILDFYTYLSEKIQYQLG